MALFYKGAAPGTYWHMRDARIDGFVPKSPGAAPSKDRITVHIAHGNVTTPYISFTRSYGVAVTYATSEKRDFTSAANPGYVYEIEVCDDSICKLVDPVIEIAKHLGPPWQSSYQHDGSQSLLIGVMEASRVELLKENCLAPPGSNAVPKAANLSNELIAMTRALRDAEILIFGNVPAALVTQRYTVF